jgi:hypothetical protein
MEKLHKNMAQKAREALKQIGNKYVGKYLEDGKKVYMTALVVSGRTNVLMEIEKRKNFCPPLGKK